MLADALKDLADLKALQAAQDVIYRHISATPQIQWPLLSARAGCEVWVKHENHTPIGAFKVRGGLLYLTRLRERQPCVTGVISATRGNHGQSLALAAAAVGLQAVIVVPEGNNPEKNAAMQALGAELVVHGADFQEAAEFAQLQAVSRGLHMVPSYHPWLVTGVATYGLEFFSACPDLDALYVPIGMGSGICGLITAKQALGVKTKIYGVVADGAPAYKLSFEAAQVVTTPKAETLADGVACRSPDPTAFSVILAGAADVVSVSEAGIKQAMAIYVKDTHNLAEGAGAAPLAALLDCKERHKGDKVGVVLSGGNVDSMQISTILKEYA